MTPSHEFPAGVSSRETDIRRDLSFGRNRILHIWRALFLALPVALLPAEMQAAASLCIEPITWNVVGLDSNNVNVGPNKFPVGARVKNTGDAIATDVSVQFFWDSANPFINLIPASMDTLTTPSLAPGEVGLFYFNAEVTRDSDAYDTARRYHITATATGVSAVSTPSPRELYVEQLLSQSRNDVLSLELVGPDTVTLGETRTFILNAETTPNGYGQLQVFINFPNEIFRILKIDTTYSNGETNDIDYADACGWDNVPSSPDYRECMGIDNLTCTAQTPFANGDAGGDITAIYTVKVVGSPTGNIVLDTLIHDQSGNSYHYNADFGQLQVVICNDPLISCAADVTVNADQGLCSASSATVALEAPTASNECGGAVVTLTNDAPLTYPVGETIVTWTATDDQGNTATCQQKVTVLDDQPPSFLECAADVTVDADQSECSASSVTVELGEPDVTDNCGLESVTNDAPDTFPVGTTIVTWTATDDSGNTATCEQSVKIEDDEDPVILNCGAGDITVDADQGECNASSETVNLGTPTVTDNCGLESLTNNAPDPFPVGTTIVTWTATDIHGNTATCQQSVTVNDNQDPVFLNCGAGDITVDADQGDCSASSATVNLGTPSVTDNCGLESLTNNAPNPFPVGTTIVTWTATDVHGNTATCQQSVTVEDDENPVFLNCGAGDITVDADQGDCSASSATVNLGTPTVTDNCGLESLTNNAPDPFPVGSTIVTWTATDVHDNVSTCQQSVTVEDDDNPVFLNCGAGDIIVDADQGDCSASSATVNLGTPTVTDNCGLESLTNDAPDPFPVGTTIVTWTATDVHDNVTTCQQTVKVEDDENPVFLNCGAGDITVDADQGECNASSATVNLGTPTVTDNCGLASLTNDAPDPFPVGTTVVTWTATDIHGNVATCQQSVTVEDDENPVFLNCGAGDITVDADQGDCSASSATVNLGTPTVTDNCGLASLTNDAPDPFPAGTTVVTWTATDIHGNTATCQQSVTVEDDENPVFLNCGAGDITVDADQGECNVSSAPVNLGTPTVTDNCGLASLTNDAPDPFPVGVTVVTWTATDIHGNTATCEQSVTVEDVENPLFLNCGAGDITVDADQGDCSASSATVNLGTPTVTDNCGLESLTNDAPDPFPVGTTIVTWTATDVHDNVTTCQQSVTVEDDENPVFLNCGAGDIAVDADRGDCSASSATVNLGTPTVTDNCGLASLSNNAPDPFPVGVTIVTWTATDIHGNVATCQQSVTVEDDENPVFLNCGAGDITVDADQGDCSASSATVNLGTPTVTDNCGIASLSNNAPNPFPVGVTIVTWTATDIHGNTATCQQSVTVNDTQDPDFLSCAADISVSADSDLCGAAEVELGEPEVTDNCGVESVTNDAPTTFPVGTTIVTWTATDVHGNTATCQQSVTVNDREPPSLECPADVHVGTDDEHCCEASDVDLGEPEVSDNCGVTTVTNNAPDKFLIGTTIVIWTVTDVHGNVTTCSQEVIVDDTHPPIMECQADMVVGTDSDQCAATDVVLNPPLAVDICSSVTVTNDAPDTFPVGTTIVTWLATDDSGNTATCQQSVTVIDDDDPVIVECAPDITISADAGLCGAANAELGGPDVTDNCGVATITNNAPETLPVGTTVVTWTITDVNGNAVTCIQTVTVEDDEPPQISCPDDIIVTAERDDDSAVVGYPPPVASDNCGLASVVTSPPSGSDFPIGVTVVTATATDIHGNTATCTFTITVNTFGNDPPVANPDDYIVLNGEITTSAPGVLENDTDPENDPLTAELVQGPTSGSLLLNPDGSFTYTAFGVNPTGIDTFTYRANDGLLDSNVTTVTLTLVFEQVVDDNELYAKTAKVKLNWAKPNTDIFSIRGQINPRGANVSIAGATLQVIVNGTPLTPPIVLDAKGKGIALVGTGLAKCKFSPFRGAYIFKMGRADLKAALGLPNITQNGLTNLDVQLEVLGAGLDVPKLEGVFESPFKTAINKSTQARFQFSKHRTLTGVFNCNKTFVSQLPDGTFKVKVVGVIEGDAGTPIIIGGPVILHVGDASTTLPSPVVKFAVTNSKHKFAFGFKTLGGTGVPQAFLAAPTAHDLPITLEIPTAGGTLVFDTVIELKRASALLKRWKR